MPKRNIHYQEFGKDTPESLWLPLSGLTEDKVKLTVVIGGVTSPDPIACVGIQATVGDSWELDVLDLKFALKTDLKDLKLTPGDLLEVKIQDMSQLLNTKPLLGWELKLFDCQDNCLNSITS